MKLKNKITALLAALGFLTSCHDEVSAPTYTVGEADNAIVLRAGISEGGAGVMTRGAGSSNVDATANHANHLAFTSGTKAAIRIDGTWKGKANGTYTKGEIIKGSIANEVVTQTTTATIEDETADGSKHNAIEFSPAEQLYWDDYGTADPDNMGDGKGRDTGLSIYAAAVDGLATAPTVNDWTALTWTLDADQKTNDWKNKDLLISNNIKTSGPDDTYKFDERASGKLLEFKHAMSKITVRLIAKEGFPTTGVGNTPNKFASAPTVKLTGDEGDASTNAYANTVCTVNVTDGSYSGSGTPAVITMLQGTVPESQKTTYTAIYEALVVPGSVFADKGAGATDPYPIIARINADGNIYYVTSEKIRAKIKELIDASKHNDEYKTESGKNYVITVKVNKTDIDVTATIKDWSDVEAEEVTPKINVTKTYGHTGDAFTNDFDFFRSTTKANGYSKDAWVEHAEPTSGTHTYTFHDQLYWPNHNTHYFFRGVYPRVQTDSEAGWIPSSKVSTSTGSASTIAVENVKFSAGTYPSELAFGWPKTVDSEGKENGDDEICKVHTTTETQGICATEGNIHLNFQYVMSKVQFSLKSSGTVAEGNIVDLNNVTVEIIGGRNAGRIQLSDGVHDTFTDADKGNYTLHATTPESGFSVTTLDAIVPQGLSDDVKIRITVTNSNSTTDVYEAQLNKIKVKTNDGTGDLITEWKPGNYYKYELDIKKTAITVTATIKDWVTVTASDNIWF